MRCISNFFYLGGLENFKWYNLAVVGVATMVLLIAYGLWGRIVIGVHGLDYIRHITVDIIVYYKKTTLTVKIYAL